MVDLEILFTSGQGIVVPMEDRESALRFMQQAMELELEKAPRLFHLSTPFEELLIDLGDISFIRLKKDNAPRIGATLKIPAQTSFREGLGDTHSAEAPPADGPNAKDRTFTVDPQGNVSADPVAQKFEKASARLRDAEARLEQVDVQRRRVEAELRKTAEELEDATREAELRKNIEAIEIDKEIERLKNQGPS
ncbi:MAG: hypothetical protein ACO1RX_19840 [Candidatus Sericytochromatia bacterium]